MFSHPPSLSAMVLFVLISITKRSRAVPPIKSFDKTVTNKPRVTIEEKKEEKNILKENGEEYNVSSPFIKEVDLDDTIMNRLKRKALESHSKNILQARNDYWSAPEVKDDDELKHYTEGEDSIVPTVQFDSYYMDSPSWSIPDFSNDFEEPCIFVTRGASSISSSSSNLIKATPLFTPEECKNVIDDAEEHFRLTNNGKWSTLPSGRFEVIGFNVKEVPSVHSWFNSMLEQRLFPTLLRLFPKFAHEMIDLVCDNALFFKYTTETGERSDVHTDSGCMSFTIALNAKENYEGGGTWFDSLGHCSSSTLSQEDTQPDHGGVINMDVGHVTFRPGGVRHRGDAITKGVRYMIGGFVMQKNKVEIVRLLTRMGTELSREGKYQQAEEALKGAIQLNPKFDAAYINLADVLVRRGKQEEAMNVLEEGRKVNPNNGEAAYTLGMMKKKLNDLAGAKECFDACLVADKWDTEAMMGNAVICAEYDDRNEEQFWFSKVISTPCVNKNIAASAYSNLGVIFGEKGQKEDEIVMYQKALELVPDHYHALNSLALAYGSNKKWIKSIENFHLALKACGDTAIRSSTLRALYRVIVMKMQSDSKTCPKTQQEVLNTIVQLMGQENYNDLMKDVGKR